MKSKNNFKSFKEFKCTKFKTISKNPFISNQKNNKIIPKKNYSTIFKLAPKKKQTQIKKKKNMLYKSKSQINNEDSSTNCLSGFNNKKNSFEKNNVNNIKNNGSNIIPFLITKARQSETESFFINYKLGEKDSYIENLLKNDSKNYDNNKTKKISLKNDFDYCRVNKDCGQNENDSLEIYDFNDEENVDNVLNFFSNLSCDKSRRNNLSNILEDCYENKDEKNEKLINDVKIFEVKNKFIQRIE